MVRSPLARIAFAAVLLAAGTDTYGAAQAPPAPGTFNSNSSADASDPVRCFDGVWRDARNAVQAYQIVYAKTWPQEAGCRERSTAAPELGPCWDVVMQARPLIEQAAHLYETARRTPEPKSGELVHQGNTLMGRAAALVDQAGKCFAPIFAKWQQAGGRYAPTGRMDTFSSGSGGNQPPLTGGVQTNQPGVDPVCGDSLQERQNKDRLFGTTAVVLPEQQAIPLIQQGKIITCNGCPKGPLPPKFVCWFNPANRPQPPSQPPGATASRPHGTDCAALPLAPDVVRQLQDLNAKTASIARVAASTGAGFLAKMAQAMGARAGMYLRAADDVASLSPYQLPFTLADTARRERIARRLMAIYEFGADTTDNIRVGFQYMDRHPKESAWILYRGAVQAVQDLDRDVQAIKKDPTLAGPLVGTAATDAAVAAACAWGGKLLISTEEISTVGRSAANLERIEGVFKPAGIQAFGNWRKATPASQEFVDLWHGSRSNATAIARDGFTYRADTVTYFGNTREAAQNAITGAVDPATDPGIFRVRLPREVWNSAVENGHVFERPYAGFGGVLQGSTTREYRMNTPAMIDTINRFRERVQ